MPNHPEVIPTQNKAYLLPAYDEFAIAYKDRDALVMPKYKEQARYVIFDPVIVIDNQIVGNWRRTIKPHAVDISYNLFGQLNKTQDKALEIASKKYTNFLL